ncbi:MULTISPECIES: hypothetical protein [Citrobacter freundii complex]|uniref:hypothetical protein n=1 Tax=Citrobacter freundii complex TaxID=1344959 RepID=UPI001D4FB904|nr:MULTISPECIES: hypothetical protein [Citrobacter freundii complex]MCW8352057.1 hypothetical protein [Citrobacter portucalensis]MCX9050858.1 hypothetical protein [Citrobacter portucalensis]CAE6129363.1 hypothetical protein AI2602V1_2134 [Citrobacter freundii]CAH3289864.1 hypothetical protein AI2602V1_2134 [Citrobacter freundii]CAH6044146.1 hypothetical protein AI3058V1_2063 [Citrobacter freundii]
MTTNNHPAHGPVSLDRLHQISEILSKAAAQSDGGNLGYAMADAVKVIDGAIATFGAEPAPVDIEMLATVLRNAPLAPSDSQGKPRAPVVPDEDPRDAFERTFKMPKHVTRCGTGYAVTEYSAWLAHDFIRMWEGWKACRAAMLQAGNSPVIQDGWQLVPKEPTEAMNKAGWAAMNEHDAINPTYRAMLAAAPQQDVRLALEIGMSRYAGAMQKLVDSGD